MNDNVYVCETCGKSIILGRAHTERDDDSWCSCRVGAHGRDFCSMKCADAWEKDPKNAEAIAESMAHKDCVACVIEAHCQVPASVHGYRHDCC